jgi:hypothetical protein
MSHPANRSARRAVRAQRIASRYKKIAWIHCETCYPAPCRCADLAARVGRLAKTPVPCSCWMCGNPRRYLKEVTLAVRRSALSVFDD